MSVSDHLKNHWQGSEEKTDLVLNGSMTSLLARFTLLLIGHLRHTKEKQATTKPNKTQAIKTEMSRELCLCVCMCDKRP